MIDLKDYYSGGYFLIRSETLDARLSETVELPEGMKPVPFGSSGLLPGKILSYSEHMADKLHIHWGWKPGNRKAAIEFGIPAERLQDFILWCGTDYRSDADYDGMFFSVNAARQFIQNFQLDTTDLCIIGAGLHKELALADWQEEPQSEIDDVGIEKRIRQQVPLESGGIVFGFEVVGFSHHNFDCSWLCNYLHQDMFNLYNIRPNGYGLIDTYAQAKKVLDWINEDPKSRAEPVPYDVWMMVSYPLTPDVQS